MPGGTKELSNPIDFPAATLLAGTEKIPALRSDGTPVFITPSQLISPATNSGVTYASWQTLADNPGTVRGQKGEVIQDGGTHVDPVTGATQPNNGVYSWSVNPAGWQYIAPTVALSLTNEIAARAAADTAEAQARASADQQLGQQLTTETQARAAADTAEAQARASADQQLGQQLAVEAQARANAIAEIGQNVAQEINTAIASEAQARADAIAQEAQARTAGDAALGRLITTEAQSRGTAVQQLDQKYQQAVAAEVQARIGAVANEANARQSGDTSLAALITAATLQMPNRPGDSPYYFTTARGGAPAAVSSLDPAGTVGGGYGAAYRVSGAAFVAARQPVEYDLTLSYYLQFRFVRSQAPSDPNNDLVRCAIQWLDINYNEISITVIADVSDATPDKGQYNFTARVPSLPTDTVTVNVPVGTIYWRPYIETFGADGKTDLTILRTQNVTGVSIGVTYTPGLDNLTTALNDEIQNREDADASIEGSVAFLVGSITQSSDNAVEIADADGFVELVVDQNGLRLGFGSIGTMSGSDLSIADEEGFIVATLGATGLTSNYGKINQTDFAYYAVADEFGYVVYSIDKTGIRSQYGSVGFTTVDEVVYADELGYVTATVGKKGVAAQGLEIPNVSRVTGIFGTGINNGDIMYADAYGFVGYIFSGTGQILTGSSKALFSPTEIANASNRAVALSAMVRDRVNADTATLAWNLNHFIAYGQSLMTGQEGWPNLPWTTQADLLMMGQSSRNADLYSANGTAFSPVGGSAAFQPLAPTVQANYSGYNVLESPSDVAKLSAGDPSVGETILESALYFVRRLLNLARPGQTFRMLGTNLSVPGRTIEALSPGANPNLYAKIPSALQTAKGLATAQGWTYGVGAILWAQGEYNYEVQSTSSSGVPSNTTDKNAYEALENALYAQIAADVAAVSGQSDVPSFITYQTNGGFTVDSTGLSIGMAQWELSKNNPRYVLASPSYHISDKGGHLDPNGYRWLGLYYGKALYETVVLRRAWRPLEPITAVLRGNQILATFNAPHAPLQFQPMLVGSESALNQVLLPNKGFTVTDGNGNKVAISSVSIVGDAAVLITLSAAPAQATLWYGRLDDGQGGGNLCDSDPTLSPFNYTYIAGNGQYAAANIAALVGKPYPLWNWCVAFQLACTQG